MGQVTAPAVLERVLKKLELLELDPALYTPASLANMVTVKAVKDTNLLKLRCRITILGLPLLGTIPEAGSRLK